MMETKQRRQSSVLAPSSMLGSALSWTSATRPSPSGSYPFVSPLSSSTTCIVPHAPLHLLPPNSGQTPPLLQSYLYVLPPTDSTANPSYHPEVRNPQIHSTFKVGESSTYSNPNMPSTPFSGIAHLQLEELRQQIAALEATLGTTSHTPSHGLYTPLPMYSENVEMDLCRKIVWNCPSNGRILSQRLVPSLMEVYSEVRLEEDRTSAMSMMEPKFEYQIKGRGNQPQIAWNGVAPNDLCNPPSIPCFHLKKMLGEHKEVQPITPYMIENHEWKAILDEDLSSGRMIGTARHSMGLYLLDDDASSSSISKTSLLSSYFSTSEKDFDVSSLSCDVCIRAKQHQVSFPLQPYKPTRPFTLVHSDVLGPSKVTTSSRKRWFVTFIDDHTRLTWVFLIFDKSKVTSTFWDFYHTIEMQFNTKIAILQSDNNHEFQNQSLNEFLSSKGIVHQSSYAFTPNKIGLPNGKTVTFWKLHIPLCCPLFFFPISGVMPFSSSSHQLHVFSCPSPPDIIRLSQRIPMALTKQNSLLGLGLACLLAILCTNEAINASTIFMQEKSHKGSESPIVHTTPVQGSEPIRDQGMTNSINSHSNNRMSENDRSKMNSTDSHTDSKAGENDRSETAVPQDIGE
ncbi:Beta-galactosidase [Cucumis melo var. makuwa]|uniref:Beta-galactosidase n=1 Tax=Cucumis melo var. makuwa TaxID=1194695 RepID=A0A5D3E0J3_CUCMM|nr:Beta-galactosidase [Cucumis melo var. makuwa]